jgi:hypothetical protein
MESVRKPTRKKHKYSAIDDDQPNMKKLKYLEAVRDVSQNMERILDCLISRGL